MLNASENECERLCRLLCRVSVLFPAFLAFLTGVGQGRH
jgi:hypothetical protein